MGDRENVTVDTRREVQSAQDVRAKLLQETQELEKTLRVFRARLEATPPALVEPASHQQKGRRRLWKW